MSNSLVSLNSLANLMKGFGLRDKSVLKYSIDGECLYLKGKVEVLASEEKEVSSTSGRSVKTIKVPRMVRITPSLDIRTDLVSRANIARVFVQVNPKLFELGTGLMYPVIIEPLTEDTIFVNLTVNEGVTLEQLEELEHFVRVYILS